MTDQQVQKLARKIARDLFTNGQGERADRLVLTVRSSPYDLGGWGEKPLADRIGKLLAVELGDPR